MVDPTANLQKGSLPQAKCELNPSNSAFTALGSSITIWPRPVGHQILIYLHAFCHSNAAASFTAAVAAATHLWQLRIYYMYYM